ncbi:hypothetical protein GCM10027049_16910 [Mucilaginibacter puniceus]
MENTENNNPKDEQITNDDNSVTNADNTAEEPNKHPEPEQEVAKEIPTVTPSNDGDPTPAKPEDEDTSNTHNGPAGENL